MTDLAFIQVRIKWLSVSTRSLNSAFAPSVTFCQAFLLDGKAAIVNILARKNLGLYKTTHYTRGWGSWRQSMFLFSLAFNPGCLELFCHQNSRCELNNNGKLKPSNMSFCLQRWGARVFLSEWSSWSLW